MTRDEIIKLAQEIWGASNCSYALAWRLERFATLVAAKERYRNPLSDEQITDLLEKEFLGEPGKRNLRDDLRIARVIEQAIRARGE